MAIAFENEGEIDLSLIRTFGVSIKDGENPIGFFGTGLKYAIAILIRNGCKIKIYSGEQELNFKKQKREIRGRDVEFILMNDEELPFTTHLGVNWEIWQAFRELYCNCKDEGGEVFQVGFVSNRPKPTKGKTLILVSGKEFEDCFHNLDQVILTRNPEECVEASYAYIYRGNSSYLYYRGIRALKLDKPSIFTHNVIAEMKLTEDRTLSSPEWAGHKVIMTIVQSKDADFIREAITAPQGTFENDLNFGVVKYLCVNPSSEFHQVLADEFNGNSDQLNASARQYHKDIRNEQTLKNIKPIPMTDVEDKMLSRAVDICSRVYSDFTSYQIVFVDFLGEKVVAFADRDNKRIVLSRRCFVMGTKYLVSTLIEEYLHLRTGYNDCTREFQSHLFDQISSLIESHVIMEPI